MNTNKRLVIVIALLLSVAALKAANTEFTYQGLLLENDAPANGFYDLDFAVWDSPTNGNVVSFGLLLIAQPVSNGLFTVELDFNDTPFDGGARWLEIGVRTNGAPIIQTLSSRQRIASTPYSIRALNATTMEGGSVINPAFVGTDDNSTFALYANDRPSFRIEPRSAAPPNLIGGFFGNAVGATTQGATISGGGGTGNTNRVAANFGTIGGGSGNLVGGSQATIAGGAGNSVMAHWAAIGGGQNNTVSGRHSTVAGGNLNQIETNAESATIGGGHSNFIHPHAGFATIPGGSRNSATNYAFAAGRRAKANHMGSFVWADSTDADFGSSSNNQFNVRAGGGVRIETSAVEVTGANGTLLRLQTSEDQGSDVGLVIQGARNGTTTATPAYIDFEDYDSNEGSGTNFVMSRIGGGMGHVSGQRGDLRVFSNDGTGLKERMRVTPDGDVGIGTANPSNPLHVHTPMNVDSSIRLTSGGSWGLVLNQSPNSVFSISNGGQQRFSIEPGGDVGIGTANPITQLHVADGGSPQVSIESTDPGGHRWTMQSSSPTYNSRFEIVNRTMNANRFTILTNGNVGLGTVAPNARLHVNGSVLIPNGQAFSALDSTGTARQMLVKTAGDETQISTAAGEDVVFKDGSAVNMTIKGSGNVGIGVSNPSKELEVNGEIEATGDIVSVVGDISANNVDATVNVTAINEVKGAFVRATGAMFSPLYNTTSDRNRKENIQSVNPEATLDKVIAMPVQTWNFKGDDILHLGPMAQDFHAAFGLGASDTTIATVDADGVALAAIQGLNQKLERENKELRQRLEKLESWYSQNLKGAQ